eukprot:8216033-Lingulodinium_polyedra.AAC.1
MSHAHIGVKPARSHLALAVRDCRKLHGERLRGVNKLGVGRAAVERFNLRSKSSKPGRFRNRGI